MMIEQATVLDYHNGVAHIQCFAKSGCGGCAATGCGTKALSALAGEKHAPQFELAVPVELKTGDTIEIGIAENNLIQSVLWLYGLPLLALLGSTLFFSSWIVNELWLALCVAGCTISAFVMIKKIIKYRRIGALVPTFVRKL